MMLIINSINVSLKKSYLKQDLAKADFIRFKTSLEDYFAKFNPNESEEHQKNNIAEFLKNAFYKDSNLINTKGRIDLAVYNGNSYNDSIGVLIEVKSLKNRNEMLSHSKPNVKALHEAISYYLDESISRKNKDIKNIIITNSEDWYIFDGSEFEQAFYKNSYLVEKFTHHREELFGAATTDWFYAYLRDEVLPKIEDFSCTYFNLNDYKDKIHDPDFTDEMILLYKVLSPEHLLKKPFANDSNSLDTQFYNELLHLIGLEEVNDAGLKILTRLPVNKRNDGSLLENTIRIIEINNSIDRVENLKEFGEDKDEQIFSVALELCITWLNRILFLKLLESQLIKYNDNDFAFKFLTIEKISDFDELNELFFEVLAIKPENRAKQDISRFSKIPYLNSSLFEQTQLEKDTITISSLRDRYTLPLYYGTVLKTLSGEKSKGDLRFQEYLFKFLDAYNFASVSKATIQETNKTIINSSVLGMIFEKLNGYKEGSFFTPGFITTYMCRESITNAAINKFNSQYNWQCKSLIDIYNKMETSSEKLLEYNMLFNSLHLIDPAVGSGHFLVSALNEFINIKAELGILIDNNGKRLKDYKFYIENDELIIIDFDGHIFSYLSPEKVSGSRRDELQRIQETLFHEKQTIIENCLFGVDINQKSVSISRLRLWIELLKFMYYKPNSVGNYELETLPNIDINIKAGNSLISKFQLTNTAIKKADAGIIPFYKLAVSKYKNIKNASQKRTILKEIENYKNQLTGFLLSKSLLLEKLSRKRNELKELIEQGNLFGDSRTKKEEKEFTKKVDILTAEIQHLEQENEEIKNNPISNTFEWRFEFPEVLDDNGDYIGFDIVIGNPPYFGISKMKSSVIKAIESLKYKSFARTGDIYQLFIERGIQILNQNGVLGFITSNKWMRAAYGESTRRFLSQETTPKMLIDFGGVKVFDSATVDTNILITKNTKSANYQTFVTAFGKDYEKESKITNYISKNGFNTSAFNTSDAWIISDKQSTSIKEKIEAIGTPLKDWDINIYRGVLTGYNEAFIIDGATKDKLIAEDPNSKDVIKPILRGRDIKRYKAQFADLWLIHIPKGYTIKRKLALYENVVSEPIPHYGYVEYDDAWEYFSKMLPAIAKHLRQFKSKAEKRFDQGDYWWELRACAYLDEFEKEKIVFTKASKIQSFSLDLKGSFILNTSYILLSKNIKYVLSFLNSLLFKYLFLKYYQSGGIFGEITIQSMNNIPIAKISEEEQQPFIDLVDRILAKKEKGEDTAAEERAIDQMVYKLYGLTQEEVKIIEGCID